MMIYLVGKERFIGVKNIILNKILFFDFAVNLNEYQALIVSSKNALRALKRSKNKLKLDLSLYVVGKESANYAKALGFTNIKIPPKAYGKDLVKAFKEELKGKKCLYLRAKEIASNLDEKLVDSGAILEQIIVYENAYTPPSLPIKLERPAVIIFTAPSSIKNFLKNFRIDKKYKIVVIGKTTAAALSQKKNIFIPKEQSIKACVDLARALA